MRARLLAATVIFVIVAAVVAVAASRPDGTRHVALRTVRPDGQPVHEPAGEHEIILANGCGVERWPVKTGTDADRGHVSTKVVATTEGSLVKLPKPSHYPTNNRIAPTELHVFQITATVTQYKEEADSDIHLVLHDSGHSMIAEIPAPNCVGSTSRWRSNIASTRSTWTHVYPLSTSWHHINRRVTLRGLGFFDVPHGQTGVAPNAIELHPVIRLQLR
jgi:hypothetical protein